MTSSARNRHSIRLRGYDYAQEGTYFVTMCTSDRALLFGQVVDAEMQLNEAGRVAQQCWLDIPLHFLDATLDAFAIMPNHVHGIIVITHPAGAREHMPPAVRPNVRTTVGAKNVSPLPGATPFQSPSRTIGSIVRGFKVGVTKWFRSHTAVYAVWQRNYYEHVIRDERSLERIQQYVLANPARWACDRENPHATVPEREAAWLD